MQQEVQVLEELKTYADQNLPLVIFAEPNSQQVHLYVQQTMDLHKADKFVEDGFVMAPFNNEEPVLFLPFADALHFQQTVAMPEEKMVSVQRERTKEQELEHKQLVTKGISFIAKGKAEKIVLAREEKVELSEWDPVLVMQGLLGLYPTAFRFMWFHPQVGWWCGATPETLVQAERDSFYTMALAGTQPYEGKEPAWRSKERDEQQFVTDTILRRIKPLCKSIQVSETYTQPAGMVAHLCTDIEGKMLPETDVNAIARAIHPTPAICGTPTSVAKDFIINEEHFHRKFYAGFLGVIQIEQKSRLYVNLRSMAVKDKRASLFIGGGITIDSNPQEEWIETCNKTQTMLRVLKPLIAKLSQ